MVVFDEVWLVSDKEVVSKEESKEGHKGAHSTAVFGVFFGAVLGDGIVVRDEVPNSGQEMLSEDQRIGKLGYERLENRLWFWAEGQEAGIEIEDGFNEQKSWGGRFEGLGGFGAEGGEQSFDEIFMEKKKKVLSKAREVCVIVHRDAHDSSESLRANEEKAAVKKAKKMDRLVWLFEAVFHDEIVQEANGVAENAKQ